MMLRKILCTIVASMAIVFGCCVTKVQSKPIDFKEFKENDVTHVYNNDETLVKKHVEMYKASGCGIVDEYIEKLVGDEDITGLLEIYLYAALGLEFVKEDKLFQKVVGFFISSYFERSEALRYVIAVIHDVKENSTSEAMKNYAASLLQLFRKRSDNNKKINKQISDITNVGYQYHDENINASVAGEEVKISKNAEKIQITKKNGENFERFAQDKKELNFINVRNSGGGDCFFYSISKSGKSNERHELIQEVKNRSRLPIYKQMIIGEINTIIELEIVINGAIRPWLHYKKKELENVYQEKHSIESKFAEDIDEKNRLITAKNQLIMSMIDDKIIEAYLSYIGKNGVWMSADTAVVTIIAEILDAKIVVIDDTDVNKQMTVINPHGKNDKYIINTGRTGSNTGSGEHFEKLTLQ